MSNGIDFSSLERVEHPFEFDGKKYKLMEPSTAAVRKFRNESSKGMTIKDGKAQGMVSDPGRLEILLVSLCVKDVDANRPVTEKEVEAWPNRLTKDLFKRAFKLGGLKETDAEEQLKLALEQPGSPVSYEALKEFVTGLPQQEYGNAQALFDDLGEDPKN